MRSPFSFFFFKQKAAYEGRIIDWSSDVCSSDLFAADTSVRIGAIFLGQAAFALQRLVGEQARHEGEEDPPCRRMRERENGTELEGHRNGRATGQPVNDGNAARSPGKIGRASGREEEGTYG